MTYSTFQDKFNQAGPCNQQIYDEKIYKSISLKKKILKPSVLKSAGF